MTDRKNDWPGPHLLMGRPSTKSELASADILLEPLLGDCGSELGSTIMQDLYERFSEEDWEEAHRMQCERERDKRGKR